MQKIWLRHFFVLKLKMLDKSTEEHSIQEKGTARSVLYRAVW
jgi:hypothetical protein